MPKASYRLEIDYDPDGPDGPTHQASVQPGSAHLPVRGQPTEVTGSAGTLRPPVAPHCLIIKLPPPLAPPGKWMLHRHLL